MPSRTGWPRRGGGRYILHLTKEERYSAGFSSHRLRESRGNRKNSDTIGAFSDHLSGAAIAVSITAEPCKASIIRAVTKTFTIRAVVRRRGNPNWGRPVQPRPGLATEFEQEVHRLGLTMQTCADSGPLRYWCERNCNRCYVPEWLLRAWRIDVDPSLSDTPPHRTWLARGTARRPIA